MHDRQPEATTFPRSGLLGAITICLALAALLVMARIATPRSTTVLDGLTAPRGLALDRAGNLYIAETGEAPGSGRLLRLRPNGRVDVLARGLPVLAHNANERVGAAAVTRCGGHLYLATGEGADPRSSAVLLVEPNGTVRKVADLGAFDERYRPDGVTRESNPFAIVCDARHGDLLVADSSANAVLRVVPNGSISIATVWKDDPVPTGLALAADGTLYVALFSPWPHVPGSGRVVKLSPDGTLSTAVSGLTTPIGVALDPRGRLLVLEFTRAWDYATLRFLPGGGQLLRIDSLGRKRRIVHHLDFPTALLPALDGGVYLSDNGAFMPVGSGRVLHIALPN